MNPAKEGLSKNSRKEELMGTKQQSSQIPVPSSPLGGEQKVFSSSSPESRLENLKRGSSEPKNLQHRQVTCTGRTASSWGIPPQMVGKKEYFVSSPQSEKFKKTRGGSQPGCEIDTHKRGESEEIEGAHTSKVKSDTESNISEKDSATLRSSPRLKGSISSITPCSPDLSISGSSRLKSQSFKLKQQSTSTPPSPVLLRPAAAAAVSRLGCAGEEEKPLFLPQQRIGGTNVKKENDGCGPDKSSSPGTSLCGQYHTKTSLPSTAGVTPPAHSKRDGNNALLDKIGSGKGEIKVPALLQHRSSPMHAVTTTISDNNNNIGVMAPVVPKVGAIGSQQTLVTRGSKELPVTTGGMVSNTNTSQCAVGKTKKLVSAPQHSKGHHSGMARSVEDTKDSTSAAPPNKRRRASTNFMEYEVYSGRDGTLSGSAPQSTAPRDPAFVLAKKTMSAVEAEKKKPNIKHNLKGKGTREGLQIVKKTPGIQNATRKVLESLRSRGPMAFSEISNILPKLSKAKASMLLDVVRVAGLVREVKGQGSSPPSYHFLGESAASDFINLGSISSDTRARLAEIRSTKSRIAAIREILSRSPEELDYGEVSELVKVLSKSDKSLDEDPLYTLIRNYAPT